VLWTFVLLVFGIVACASAVIIIRLSQIPPVTLAAYRLLGAALFLSPLFFREWRAQHGRWPLRQLLTVPFWPALMLALHFITWIMGARLTPAANASLIVNLAPLVMPFLLYLFLRERINRKEAVATVFALVGVAVLGFSDYTISATFLQGDVICFVSMLFFSIYLVLGRKNRSGLSLWLYMVPLYFYAFCFCLLCALCLEAPLRFYGWRETGLALALALIPTVIGHTVLNYAMRRLRGQVVSILSMFQFVFAGILSYLFFREVPSATFYGVSFLLTLSGLLVTWGVSREEKAVSRPPAAATVTGSGRSQPGR